MTAQLPRVWRIVLVAVCTLILCSCRGPRTARDWTPGMIGAKSPAPPRQGSPALPQETYSGVMPAAANVPLDVPHGPPGMELGVPMPYTPTGPWAPPGIALPWPRDEYLADGGDSGVQVAVTADRQVRGLEMEDTVAHYDTVDGRTVVEPSNRVYLYSPRFASVRQVVGVKEDEQMDRSVGVYLPDQAVSQEDRRTLGAHKQQIQIVGQIGQKSITTFRSKQGDGAVSTAIGPRSFKDGFQPYENLATIRTGKYEAAEMAWLARGSTAAITWTHDQGLQVLLDTRSAAAVARHEKVESVFTVGEPPTQAKLRIVKVASTQFAEPGDTIDFTIRFDNVGSQPIRSVTILDNLTPRLEYAPDSSQSSVAAKFSSSRSEGDSLVLRWELAEPLQPGRGGVLRFTCRVR
jgi:uncharacterized repeat protein (TIGR01451 family)